MDRVDWWEGADFSANRRHGTEALNRQRPRASIRKQISLFCRYIWDKINDLFDISQMDIMSLVSKAKELGLHEPKFPPKEKLAS